MAEERVNIVDEFGKTGSVNKADLEQATKLGWHAETPEETKTSEEKRRYGEGVLPAIQAAGLGLARGATASLSDVALTKLGLVDPETIRGLQEQQPIASTAGELASIALPFGPATKLAGASASLAAKAASISGLGRFAAKGLASRIIAKGAEHAVAGALPGAVYGTGAALSDAMLKDQELSSEVLLGGLKTGAIFGGAVGGVTGGLLGIKKPFLERDVESSPGIVRRALANGLAKTSAALSGSDEEALRQFSVMTNAERAQYVQPSSGDKIVDAATRKLVSQINAFEKIAPDIEEHALGQMKLKQVASLMQDRSASQVAGDATSVLSQIDGQIDTMQKEGAQVFGRLKDLKDARALTDKVFNKIASLSSSEEPDAAAKIFLEMDKYKRRFGKIAKPGRFIGIGTSSADDAATQSFRDIYIDTLMPHLEDANIYGDAAADLQKSVNKKWTDYLGNNEPFKKFITRTGTDQFNPQFEANPSAVHGLVANIDHAGRDLELRSLRGHMERRLDLLNSIGEHYDLPEPAVRKLGTAKQIVEDTLDHISHIEKEVGLVHRFRDITQRGPMLEPAYGAAIGGAALGPVGATAGFILGSLATPGQTMRRLAGLETLRQGMASSIDKSLHRFMKISKPVIRGATGAAIDVTTRKKKDDYKKRLSRLSQYMTDPDMLAQDVHSSLEGSELAPEDMLHLGTKISSAIQFLHSKAPKNPTLETTLTPLADTWQPSDNELSSFYRYVRTVEDPLTVLQDMESGNLSKESSEALRAVYPKLQQFIASQIAERASVLEKQLPYQKRVLLSMFFGVPVDQAMKPAMLTAIQDSYAKAEAAKQQQEQRAARPNSQKSTMSMDRFQKAQWA